MMDNMYQMKGVENVFVEKTGDTKGDVAKWFNVGTDSREKIQGTITNFTGEGRKGSMPKKIFDKNFEKVVEKDCKEE
jgi:hypothetical protein